MAERDHLDVEVGVGGADRLDAELVVLAQAAGLRALVAERRGEVPDLPRRRRPVLDEGPHHRRGPLGPQRDVAVALVVEVVHLLAHDVGALADPLEDADVLEQRTVREAEAVARGDLGERRDQPSPASRLRRQHVLGADRGLELLGHGTADSSGEVTTPLISVSHPARTVTASSSHRRSRRTRRCTSDQECCC